ncbi:MAG: MFS transporter [Promethearchaeota archaeon]
MTRKNNQNLKENSKKSIPMLFALPRLGTSLVLGIEGFALFTLYSTVYALDPFLTGFAQAMGYLSIAAAQFLLGWLSDTKYFKKLGRRKPYLLIVAPILCVSFIFLLLPGIILPDLGDKSMLFTWLLTWDVIFRASYAVTTPYQAWMAEIIDVKKRPKVSQLQNTFNFIGNGIMAITTLLVLTGVFDKIKEDINTIPIEFLAIVISFGLISWVLFYITSVFIPTEPYHEIKSTMKESIKVTWKNRNFKIVMLMQGISGIAWSIMSSVMLTYTEDVLVLSFIEYLIIAISLLLSIFIFLYFWRRKIESSGKKQVLLNVIKFGVLFSPITVIGIFAISFKLIFGIIFIVGVGAVLGGWYIFPYIMYADLAENDGKETGELRAGIYTGFPSIILNLFQALGIFILGSITSLPDIIIQGNQFSIGLIIWGPICSLILLLSYFFTKKFVVLDYGWEK